MGKQTSAKMMTKYSVRLVLVAMIQIVLLGLQSCDPAATPETTNSTAVLGNENPPPADGVSNPVVKIPNRVELNTDSIARIAQYTHGDNWSVTWTADDNQMTSMSDGSWTLENPIFHNMAYRIEGGVDDFVQSKVLGYPEFLYGDEDEPGWFGYGIVAIDETIYSMVTKTPGTTFQGPFRGIKMLKSTDNGDSWYRVNRDGETRLLKPTDAEARNSTAVEDMFFLEENGTDVNGLVYFPFSFVSFVQNGQAGQASPDGYIYIYSPEGAKANHLLLARVKKEKFEIRDNWEYFKQWNGDAPVWSSDITERGNVMVFPEQNANGDTFGWYSWLPSVVWNEGLGVYVMVNGGTYTFKYNWNTLDLTGSLGFWYSLTPYGPWKQIYYTDHFIADDPRNRTYQPKLSPKWISENGEEMVLIWSDAMADELGNTHTVNYRWNQMKINLKTDGNQLPTVFAGIDQSIQAETSNPNQTFLNGTFSDDGLPLGSTLHSQWSKLSGPGSANFADINQPQTFVSFDLIGRYELQLRVTDGELSQSDTVIVDVQGTSINSE